MTLAHLLEKEWVGWSLQTFRHRASAFTTNACICCRENISGEFFQLGSVGLGGDVGRAFAFSVPSVLPTTGVTVR